MLEHEQYEKSEYVGGWCRISESKQSEEVRDDGSSGNGNWLHMGVVYQINKYVEDNGSQASY